MNKIVGIRKFALAGFASVCAVALCWHKNLSGAEWVTAQSLILGLYKTANVLESRREPAKQ